MIVASGVAAAVKVVTNAVVAICVVFVSTDAVGAIGMPVREGDKSGALAFICGWILLVTPFKYAIVSGRSFIPLAVKPVPPDTSIQYEPS